MRNRIISIISLLLSTLVFSQNNLTTNVDTNYFKPLWSIDNLAVSEFRDGVKIHEAKSEKEFNEILYQKDVPAYFVKRIESVDHYFYNWYAINSFHLLSPIGYKIPSSTDFQSITNKADSSLSFNQKVIFYSPGYIDNIEGFTENSGNQLFYWTSEEYKMDSKKALGFLYDQLLDKTISCYFPMYKNFGLSVRCIEDLEYSIKTKRYEYKYLMPDAYNNLILDWVTYFKSIHSFSKDEKVYLVANIGYSRNGNQIASLEKDKLESFGFTLKDKSNSERILNNFATNRISIPLYQGQIIESSSNIKLTLEFTDSTLKKGFFDISKIQTKNGYNKTALDRAESNQFKTYKRIQNFIAKDNGTIVYQENTTGIERFKSKGPIYSIGAVIPGLGLGLITRNHQYSSNLITRNHQYSSNFKNVLLGTSISLGAISIVSKLYSIREYKKYLNSAGNLNDHYRRANTSQKVFLVSATGYGVLSLIDFTVTFTIGCKNKIAQHQLNKVIGPKRMLLLK